MLRSCMLPALLLAAACGARPQPHRFGSPMLGNASVPSAPLPGYRGPNSGESPAPRDEPRSVRAEPIRAATMPQIREVSMSAVAALPGPHRTEAPPPAPTVRVSADLRALVGHRDTRDPVVAALGWARELGMQIDATTGAELVTWAAAHDRLHDASTPPERGDLLVFDRVNSDGEADLVGVVIARDERNVTEFLFLGGGVIRRGFVDASRPATKRDKQRAIVNTFLRTGKRWPAKGSHYLAGEHIAYVIR